MTTPSANPVAQRIIHASRGPGEAAVRWAGLGAGAAVGLAAWFGAERLPALGMAAAVLASEPALLVLCFALCFVLAAFQMSAYRRGDDYALLHISSMSAGMIARGYTEGIRWRLRMVRALCAWSPLGWGIAAALALALTASGVRLWAAALIGVGLLILAAGRGALAHLAETLIRAGIWFALRQRHHAEALAAGVGLGAAAALLASLAVAILPGLLRCCPPVLWLALVASLGAARKFFTDDAVRQVGAQLELPWEEED